MSGKKKDDIITFKVDASLADALSGVPNRSEFIRTAILAALENTCPLCLGAGILTPDQRSHWEIFRRTHSIRRCSDCEAVHIVCAASEGDEQ